MTFFFFQAEDGIRDIGVTGVQTCALPICPDGPGHPPQRQYLSGGLRPTMRLLHKLGWGRWSTLGQVRRGDWRSRPLPDASAGVPTMLMVDELRLLEFLTERYYRRAGLIVDAGCFLGGSTVALASGLRKNLAKKGVAETPLIHSYDLFKVEDWTRGIYFPEDVEPGAGTLELFERNVAEFRPLI